MLTVVNMPQESRRSAGYRPFITCNDPRGAVECGTVIKQKNLYTVREEEEEEEEEEEAQSTTSFHLSEVFRGAQKLNHVVNSWSNGNTKNSERDMAKDLLKGALDLEESLAMFSISGSAEKRLKKKKSAIDADLVVEEIQDKRSLGRRLSGSSLDEFEEIKRVNRNGVSSEEPSTTSSSQYSVVNSSNFVSPESFASSNSSQKKDRKKSRGSNLIAKLMGFEYGKKILNQQKPEFDLDLPWKSSRKRRTFDQMIEALKFRGNLKSNVLNASPNSHQSEFSNSSHWLPIVLMKPSRFSCLNMEHPIIPKPRAEVDEEMMLHKMRIRTNPLAEASEFRNFNEKEILDKKRVKGKASVTEKPRQKKKHSVGLNSEEIQKASGSRRKGERKRIPKSESHLQSLEGDKLTISTPKSSKQNWPKNDDENGKQVYKDECERESPLRLEDSNRLIEDASQIEITDYVDDDQSSSNETPLSFINWSKNNTALICPNEHGTVNHDKESQCSTSEDKKQLNSEEEDYVCVTSSPSIVYTYPRKASTEENKLKELLLSSPSFINRVEEIFELQRNPDKDFNIDHNDPNARMLLDYANELIELHGHECSRACLPLPSTNKISSVFTSYCYTSLDQIMDEVCEEIGSFECYVKDSGGSHSIDNLLLLVKEDLRSRRMVTGVWDIGWKNLGSANEIEEITRGIDQLVLDGLIQETFDDLNL
ncbi:hypothetical protein V2J09_018829 [Rumex salicifolius]